MAGDIALDTNVVAWFLDGVPEIVARLLATDRVFVPATAVGELLYGAKCSRRVPANIARVEGVLEWMTLMPIDQSVAVEYGSIKHQLRTIGRMIPDNDIWIAAAARSAGVALATRDSHFQVVPGLVTEFW